mgnify:CR=1 FL=1
MTYEIDINDRVRTVSVARKGDAWHVTLDGTTHVVDARRVGSSALSMLIASEGTSRSIDATFATRPAEPGTTALDVHLDGHVVTAQVRPAGAFGRPKKGVAGASGTGPQKVIAPMPGKVVRVLVKPGDEVTAKQGLVVVEAMKMENELKAARAGTVRDVSVREGQSVDAGAVLLVVE